ncbi:hypothetical protein ACFWIX_08965 [Pseudarthrobacter sp. NPDC058362]|uniref:hypothetical protein n=1 Tax=Pseudarthrobacter sp. NPDC058362 TaxID=3346458 RepID=UPI00364A5777
MPWLAADPTAGPTRCSGSSDMGVLLSHPTLCLNAILEQAGRGLLGLGFPVRSF